MDLVKSITLTNTSKQYSKTYCVSVFKFSLFNSWFFKIVKRYNIWGSHFPKKQLCSEDLMKKHYSIYSIIIYSIIKKQHSKTYITSQSSIVKLKYLELIFFQVIITCQKSTTTTKKHTKLMCYFFSYLTIQVMHRYHFISNFEHINEITLITIH